VARSLRTQAGAWASALLVLSGALGIVAVGREPAPDRGPCPSGYRQAGGEHEGVAPNDEARQRESDGGGDEAEREREAAASPEDCVNKKHPESVYDLTQINGQRMARDVAPFTELRPGAYAAALAQRAAVAGIGGTWTPLGTTPLLSAEEGYDEVNTSGLVELSGRIQDFAYDSAGKRLYAAVANGGVWRSDDVGASWTSIGDNLPSQIVGSVAWSTAGGGTLLALTGDGAFGGDSYAGIGVYRSTDQGRSWQRATGVPDGAIGFKLAVDPSNPSVVYAATGFGLFRSTDAGRSFVDVLLPTGACAGHVHDKGCFLANIVTDVVVRATDGFGHQGGAVLAAVGWRAGQKQNADGSVQSPNNGIYQSTTGAPSTFTKLTPSGFTPQNRIGRVEMGIAEGPQQDHNYVWAVVEDAVKFNGGAPVLDVPETPAGPLPNPTVVDGVYRSADFGATWTKLADAIDLANPANGSSLSASVQVATYAPGVQSWYNQWVRPDPTRQAAGGVPDRVLFGLEEVWQLTGTPSGAVPARVIGRYFGGTSCLGLNANFPICPTNGGDTASSTTHPDQHGAIYVPDASNGVTVVVGNDGGVYAQHAASGEALSNARWGVGANRGLHTLLPYTAVMAKDGTVWAGLQDNGDMKIEPGGKQIMTYGGDGFFAAVDPNKSDVSYEEYTEGDMSVTTDGGKTWTGINPVLNAAQFATPFVMDPTDANHLMVGGRDVVETVFGPDTTGRYVDEMDTAHMWQQVYDLGTQEEPGNADATGIDNQLSAVDLVGDAAYVGFCGYCDTIVQGTPFANGIATNVGGPKPPKRMSGDGWHIAAAKGLPTRYITSIAADPAEPRTVYVTLGGYGRNWAPPGAVADDLSKVGTGHVFKSADAGETFTDVSGNLPDIAATSVTLRNGQLIVGTELGAFIAPGTDGGAYAILGPGLPNVPVNSVRVSPQDPDLLVVATYGRGVYTYRFPAAGPAAGAAGASQLPATGGPEGIYLGLGIGGLAIAIVSIARRKPRARSVSG
jgi:hypothetical protein